MVILGPTQRVSYINPVVGQFFDTRDYHMDIWHTESNRIESIFPLSVMYPGKLDPVFLHLHIHDSDAFCTSFSTEK